MKLGNRLAVGKVVDHVPAEEPAPTPDAEPARVDTPPEPAVAHADR